MEYKELKTGITEHLNSAAEDFFVIGYFLRQISENALFVEDGYKSIWEFAKGEYNLSTSSASRFMAINARFSIDGGEHMAQKYIGMGVSKLQEMLGLPDEELEKVSKETTVREIRAMKVALKEPLSYFGFRKTERPADSLVTTPGCRNEERGYSCSSCCHDCQIRQEPRQCYEATCGNPFPCSLMDNEEWKKNIQYSLYKDECQMLHHELAEKRAGDGEPEPCCILCKNKSCFNRCDVAKKKDEAERKREQDELRKKEREAEAKRPEPSDADIKAFYDHACIKATDTITSDDLKRKYAHSGAGGGRVEFEGSARGMRINKKKELTWAQLRDRLRKIQEAQLLETAKKEAPTEEEFLTDFYLYCIQPSVRSIIKERDKAAITKLFKQEFGSMYENGNIKSGGSYSCYPDKIVFRDREGGEAMQITWGKFVTKLVKLLNGSPTLEIDALKDSGEKEPDPEPDVIDADFKEVAENEPDEPEQETAAAGSDAGGAAEKSEAETPGREEPETEQDKAGEAAAAAVTEPDPEYYDSRDIKDLLKKHEKDLKAYREVGGMPDNMLKRERILVDALTFYLEEIDRKEAAAYEN